MTIQSSTVRVIYNGNNSTVVYYPVTFVYAVSTEVRVLVTDANSVNTELTFGTDYTVDPSGVLTTAAWDDTHTVTVYRVTDTVQLTDYVENDKFPADTHEDALDKLTRICQEIRETLTRTLQVSVNAPLSGPVPAATTRFLFIDSAGQFDAITPQEALAELNIAAGIDANYTAVFANATARAAATPLFIGQIGVQLDATGLNGFYRGTALSAGGWAQVFLGPADIQGLTSARLLGRYSSGSGNSEEIQIGTGLNLVAGILSASASAPIFSEILGVTTDSLIGRDTAGTGNAELITLGRGLKILSAALVGGSLISVDFYAASQTNLAYDADCKFAIWILQGAGNKGGDTTGAAAGVASGGYGGNAGAIAIHMVDVEALSTKQGTVTIGAANGGSTIYTDGAPTTVTAPGGAAGLAGVSSGLKGDNPTGTLSTSSGSNIFNGSTKYGEGTWYSGTNIQSAANSLGGKGADSFFGSGGTGGRVVNTGGAADNGRSGIGYGCAGGGGAATGTSSAVGGNGRQGCALRIQFK